MEDKKTILSSKWILMSAYMQLKKFLFDENSDSITVDTVKEFYSELEFNLSSLDFILGNPLGKPIK